MPADRYIAWFAAALFAILAPVALLNLLVDPYQAFRLVDLPRLNSRKPAEWQHARLCKPLDLWRHHYDGVALGTSQVERGIDPENPALLHRGIRLYNAGLSEERPFEQALLLREAAETSGIRFALISLDFLRYVGGGGRPEFLPADWTRWDTAADALKTLISGAAAKDSLAALAASWENRPTLQHEADGLLNVEPLFARIGQPDYRRAFDEVDAYYLRDAYEPLLVARDNLARNGFDHTALKDMLRTARRYRIALYFFVPPSHALQAEIIRRLGLDALFRQWEGEIAQTLGQEAERSGELPFPFWDFSGYNAVTTEPVPPAGSTARMRWYNDPVHFTYRTGRAVEDRLLGLASTEGAETAAFGERVDIATLDAHFERRAQSREQWLAARPEAGREIQALAARSGP